MSGSSQLLMASALANNNATDSGLDDEDTSNESIGHNDGFSSSKQNRDELLLNNDDDADGYYEDDHELHQDGLHPPPAPPTSPTSSHSTNTLPHFHQGELSNNYSSLPEVDQQQHQHISEFQHLETDPSTLISRPFHTGRTDLDQIDGHDTGEMELSEIKVEDPASSVSAGVSNTVPHENSSTGISNECKALIKFEFPSSSSTMLPISNLVCQFHHNEPTYYRRLQSLHVDTANHHFKDINLEYPFMTTEVPSSSSSTSSGSSHCRALIPYQQHDLHHKDRVFGYSVKKMYSPSSSSSSSSRRCHRRIHDNWNNLKKEHAEHRLRTAANSGNLVLVLKTLHDGANYDINPNSADESGRTALHLAACKGYTDIVSALLDAGASPNRKDSIGNTPLHLAACTNHFNVVTRLLRAGTDVSTLDNHGRNPLMLAQSKLRILSQCKSNSDGLIRVKHEVQQIIEMMKEYLQKKGQDDEAELLNAFATRLTLEQGDEDLMNLLANLSSLSLGDSNRRSQHQPSSSTQQPSSS